ncbi:MAG: M55 family metallopeptidase [Acidobacteria bacterium]|nr:M55 family metallopeptidase [Acidobacteriota bacterium]
MLRPILSLALVLAFPHHAPGQQQPVKVFIDLDGEGMAGIFHVDTQVMPITAPRFQESRRLQIGEVNAAIAGFFDGGADIVEVADYHSGGNTVSPMEIDKRAIVGPNRDHVMGLDRSYSAYAFIAYHSMAGAERGMIAHGWSWTDYQNLWVNGNRTGEVGMRSLLAGTFGIPVILISGDEAVCKELRAIVPNAECAVVKWGVHRTFGYALSHQAACEVIRLAAKRAIARRKEIQPYRIDGPVELKVEFTPEGQSKIRHQPGGGVEQIDSRTWVFRGSTFLEAWFKFMPNF